MSGGYSVPGFDGQQGHDDGKGVAFSGPVYRNRRGKRIEREFGFPE